MGYSPPPHPRYRYTAKWLIRFGLRLGIYPVYTPVVDATCWVRRSSPDGLKAKGLQAEVVRLQPFFFDLFLF
jgi:hypothetical protein